MRDETTIKLYFVAMAVGAVALLAIATLSVWAPCSWLGWMSLKDAPIRCLR